MSVREPELPSASKQGRRAATPPADRKQGRRAPRVPFALLVTVMVLGGMALLLALNTASAANELTRHDLAVRDDQVSAAVQQLREDVAASAAPANLARAAQELGMVPAQNPAFLVIGPDGTVRVLGHAKAVTAAPLPLPPARRRAPREGEGAPVEVGVEVGVDVGVEVGVEVGVQVRVQVRVDAPGRALQLGQAEAEADAHADPDTRLHAAGRPAMTDRRQPPRASAGGRFGPPPGGSPRGSDAPRRRVPTASSSQRAAPSLEPRSHERRSNARFSRAPAGRSPHHRGAGRSGPPAGRASRSAPSTDGCATGSRPSARCCSSSVDGWCSCRVSTTPTTPGPPPPSASTPSRCTRCAARSSTASARRWPSPPTRRTSPPTRRRFPTTAV